MPFSDRSVGGRAHTAPTRASAAARDAASIRSARAVRSSSKRPEYTRPLPQLGDPGSDIGVGDIGQPVARPRREDVGMKQGAVPIVGAGLDAGLGGQPSFGPFGDGDAAALGRGPGPRHQRRRGLVAVVAVVAVVGGRRRARESPPARRRVRAAPLAACGRSVPYSAPRVLLIDATPDRRVLFMYLHRDSPAGLRLFGTTLRTHRAEPADFPVGVPQPGPDRPLCP
jgi:hypothetical protein